MTSRALFTLCRVGFLPSRPVLLLRGKSTKVVDRLVSPAGLAISSALPAPHLTARVIFSENSVADFKYIWLRDNCRCEKCVDYGTNQKLLDTPALSVNVKPKSLVINNNGELEVVWKENDDHVSRYDPTWLYKYGQSFIQNTFESDSCDKEHFCKRPDFVLWKRAEIWENLPEMAYNEFMESDSAIHLWLKMFYKYGIAVLRGVPTTHHMIAEVVKRFAYVKETQYGHVFDVINLPTKGTHLAYSGLYLAHHTDMNYREKSPGMQLLHCLKANDPKDTSINPGGLSFFVDGFRVAKWMEENESAAFHVLTSTPVRFSIKNEGMRYSALWPVICLDSEGNVTEIHCNNRTMQPLQTPLHVVTPFYHAYKLFSEKLRDPACNLELQMVPGDLIAFNNRRVLHGRTGFDARIVNRHLQGCYVDIDEAFSKFDQLNLRFHD